MCLQTWVDKNRDLAYEPCQVEVIKMIDDILEDHIITKEEREMMVERAELFLKATGDNIANVYELNGIIEGIICDGEVNEAEVYHLKQWMDEYGDDIRNYKSGHELYKAIDDILDDGVVTEQEQSMLLDMLSARISNSQFETKLDYLCKLVKNRKNIGTDLIDILDNNNAMQEIHKRAERQLMNGLSSYSGYIANPEIIVVSLVLIAMLEYDGNYYGNVRNTYINAYRWYSYQKVEGLIRTILGRYKKRNDAGSRSRIINVVLENAIVPQAFLPAFFEFIFDIYKLNFEYDLPEEPYEDFKFVYEGLCNNLLSDGDDISINVTQKTYKLIATTKHLIMRKDGLDAIIKLSILIVTLIDKRFWDKEVRVFNPYLKVGYEGWEKRLKNVYKGGRERRRNASEMHSKWEPKYVMINNLVCLIPPVHKVKAQYDYRNIAVVVINEDVEIYRNNSCDIREIIGGYQVYSEKIVLENPLGKLKYQLVAGEEIIYDSKDKLFRNYIVFNDEGQEVNNNTDFEGTAYFCYKSEEAELQKIVDKDYYCIGYKLIRIGDAIGIGHDVFNFSSMIKPGIFGQLYTNCKIKSDGKDILLPVYKEAKVVVFEANDSKCKFEIVINGKSRKLSDMKHKTTARGGIIKYVVELELESSGIYTVEVNQFNGGKKDRVLKELFACDIGLSYDVEIIDECTRRVMVSSEILNERIDEEIAVDNFSPDFIQFQREGIVFNYYIPFDFGFYKLSDDKWYLASEELWIDDIKMDTILTIYDSKCDGLLVYTENGTLAEDDIAFQDRGYYKQLPVGFLNSYKNGNKYVLLVFTADGRAKYTIPCYNKCVLEEDGTEILFSDSPKNVLITPSFHGKNKVFFEILNTDGELIYRSNPLNSGQTENFDGFNSFEEYTINFYEKAKILQLPKNTLLLQTHKTFYAKQDFVGHVFKINEAHFDPPVNGKLKDYYFSKAYVYLMEILDDGIFLGEIFVKTMHGKWYLDGINPVEVEMCSDVVDDTMDIYITHEGDGLLLDFEKHGILNSLDSHTAPDIFLFTISTKGEVQV